MRAKRILFVEFILYWALFWLAQSKSKAEVVQTSSTNTNIPAFEVVSVKPNNSGDTSVKIDLPRNGYTAINAPLKLLISSAYGIKKELISGEPRWVDSARYDIRAKVADSDVDELRKLSFDQRTLMLQQVLLDRFKLRAHREYQRRPVYELIVTKRGPKLKEAKPGDTYTNGLDAPPGLARVGIMRMVPGQLIGQGIPIGNLARLLSQQLQRTVVDSTGLTGKYDIKLEWATEQAPASMSRDPASAPPDASGPSIFTALQEQLGLKLRSIKGPVETLVIDQIEIPSEN